MTEMAPLVSVLIPCFNTERWVAETLDSALGQTWPNIEIIVVDDGSTDASAAIVEGYADRGVRLIRQTNHGPSAARNQALAASRGEFIQYLDADDLLERSKVERQMERLLKRSDCAAVGIGRQFSGPADWARFPSDLSHGEVDPVAFLLDLTADYSLNTAGWLIPRPVASVAGPWNEGLTYGEDPEYFSRVVLGARAILTCPTARWLYRTGSYESQSDVEHSESLFQSTELMADHMIARSDTKRVRQFWAICFENMAHLEYPKNRALAERALARAGALHAPGPELADDDALAAKRIGGPRFRFLSRLMGWRAARRLQFMVYGR